MKEANLKFVERKRWPVTPRTAGGKKNKSKRSREYRGPTSELQKQKRHDWKILLSAICHDSCCSWMAFITTGPQVHVGRRCTTAFSTTSDSSVSAGSLGLFIGFVPLVVVLVVVAAILGYLHWRRKNTRPSSAEHAPIAIIPEHRLVSFMREQLRQQSTESASWPNADGERDYSNAQCQWLKAAMEQGARCPTANSDGGELYE